MVSYAEWSQAVQEDAAGSKLPLPNEASQAFFDLDQMYPMLQAQLDTMNASVDKLKYRYEAEHRVDIGGGGFLAAREASQAAVARVDRLRRLLGPNPPDPELARRLTEALTSDGATVEDVHAVLDQLERDLTTRSLSRSRGGAGEEVEPLRILEMLERGRPAARGAAGSTAFPFGAGTGDALRDERLRAQEWGRPAAAAAAATGGGLASRQPVSPVVGAASDWRRPLPRLVTAAVPGTASPRTASPRRPPPEDTARAAEATAQALSTALRNLALRTMRWAASSGINKNKRCELAELVLSCVRPVAKDRKELKNFCSDMEVDLVQLMTQRDQAASAGADAAALDEGILPGEPLWIRQLAAEKEQLAAHVKDLTARCDRVAKENKDLRSVAGSLSAEAARACRSIVVSVPDHDKPLSGVYHTIDGATPNGFPLWKQRDGVHWFYTGLKSGKWLIGAQHERDKGFRCDSGYISSSEAHNGLLPVAMVAGRWQRLVDMAWVCDASVTVAGERHEKETIDAALAEKDRIIANLGRLITEQAFLAPGGAEAAEEEDPKPEELTMTAGKDVGPDLGWIPVGLPHGAHELCAEPIFVKSIDEGSWAEFVDLQIGDQLVSVNDQDVREIEKKELRHVMQKARPLVCIFSRERPSPPSAPATATAAAVAAAIRSPGGSRPRSPASRRDREELAEALQDNLSPRSARRPPERTLAPQERDVTLFDVQQDRKMFGFTTVGMPPKPVVISKITKGSPAEKTNMIGDEIFMVNNRRVAGMTAEQLTSSMTERPLLLTFLRLGPSVSSPFFVEDVPRGRLGGTPRPRAFEDEEDP